MANIGTFKKSGDTNYTGEIVTMSLQKKNVTIVAEEASENENAPSHRVFVAKAEIGACWQKTSKEGRDYLSIKLDDPSFTAPIFASLFADEDGKTFAVVRTEHYAAPSAVIEELACVRWHGFGFGGATIRACDCGNQYRSAVRHKHTRAKARSHRQQVRRGAERAPIAVYMCHPARISWPRVADGIEGSLRQSG